MAAGLLARAMGASPVIGVDVAPARRALAVDLGSVDEAVPADGDSVERIRELTGGRGCEVAVDCSGATAARTIAVRGTRRWGRCVLVGEGNRLELEASADLIHPQITVTGSWVTSIGRMEALTEHLVRWELHPERVVTHRFGLAEAAQAYAVADEGESGKVSLVMDA
jgi:threonine dehydrogenase-like Zn-dependent dehydrogenase